VAVVDEIGELRGLCELRVGRGDGPEFLGVEACEACEQLPELLQIQDRSHGAQSVVLEEWSSEYRFMPSPAANVFISRDHLTAELRTSTPSA
jgi:hypothetical protein